MKDKVALVLSGGGSMCVYSTGSLFALIEKYNITEPDIVIAASGTVGVMAYYVAKQYKEVKDIWFNFVGDRKALNPWRFWKMADVDYLVDYVTREKFPLNTKKLYSSKTEYLIASTNNKTAEIKYFSNKKKDDIFLSMKASAAMPVAYEIPVIIDGERYIDTHVSASVYTNILKAIELGATKIIAFDVEGKDYPIFKPLFALLLWLMNKEFKKKYHEGLDKMKNFKKPQGVDLIFLKPKKPLRIGVLTNNRELLEEAFNQGFQEAFNNKKLESFVKSLN
ncbi:patatin-like phospholipase family protein [archaeon]|nr:patatin-like phospholipase family protein [archaeon]